MSFFTSESLTAFVLRNIGKATFCAVAGAVLLPLGLRTLGFRKEGPVAGSFAAHHTGGAGGGASLPVKTMQRLTVKERLGTVVGALTGLALFALFLYK